MRRRTFYTALLALCTVFAGIVAYAWMRYGPPSDWTAGERALIASLSLDRLKPLPADPSNAVADDPRAAALGQRLFFDTRLSANGLIACAHCHQPERRFTDGLPLAVALGIAPRNTPSIVGTAYSPWLYWDGRKDSQWAQALAPLEAPAEHGTTRAAVVALLRTDADYRAGYAALFGSDSLAQAGVDVVFANVGKLLAAYERRLLPGRSRFDRYAARLEDGGAPIPEDRLDAREIRGLRLFIGAAHCVDCHNGPLLTNNEFHNTGVMPPPGALPDRGRVQGLRELLADPFNCRGSYSDDPAHDCPELDFVRRDALLLGALRTPSLRNLGTTAPYGSKGQFATLADVIAHYNEATPALIGHNETVPLGLSRWEIDDLAAFLRTLDAPVAGDPALLAAPDVPAPASAEFSRDGVEVRLRVDTASRAARRNTDADPQSE